MATTIQQTVVYSGKCTVVLSGRIGTLDPELPHLFSTTKNEKNEFFFQYPPKWSFVRGHLERLVNPKSVFSFQPVRPKTLDSGSLNQTGNSVVLLSLWIA